MRITRNVLEREITRLNHAEGIFTDPYKTKGGYVLYKDIAGYKLESCMTCYSA